MRLASKLYAIVFICLLSIVAVVAVGTWSSRRNAELQATQDAGHELLMKSNQVHNRLKNLMFDTFSPRTYGLLRDVVHMPRANRLVREFEESVTEFEHAYEEFIGSRAVIRLLTDEDLQFQYNITRQIGDRSFAGIERLREGLARLDAEPVGPTDGVYRRVILEHEGEGPTLIQDARSVSYYFTATFERLLEFFISELNEQAETLQARTRLIFQLTAAIAILLSLGLTISFAYRLTRRLEYFSEGVDLLSRGEFGLSLPEGAHDELGLLLHRFNIVARDLARKIDSVSELLHFVGEQITLSPDIPNLLEVVADATIEHTHADRVAILNRERVLRVFRTRGGVQSADSVGPGGDRSAPDSFMSNDFLSYPWEAEFPLQTRVHEQLTLAVASDNHELSDLDRSQIEIFSEYVSLLIDHNEIYRELANRKSAAFEALQARIQPHFLFNILGGMFGMNREGDRRSVERYIICLRHMLRYIVDADDLTTLGNEVEFTRRYLELQGLRFGERLQVDVSCCDSIESIPVPKLVLQPLVENAVMHGIESGAGNGRISLQAECKSRHTCRIVIEDNGIGFDPQAAADRKLESESGNRSHIGIGNTRRRLAISHPGSQLNVESSPGQGTRVTIEIPLAGAEVTETPAVVG